MKDFITTAMFFGKILIAILEITDIMFNLKGDILEMELTSLFKIELLQLFKRHLPKRVMTCTKMLNI